MPLARIGAWVRPTYPAFLREAVHRAYEVIVQLRRKPIDS